MKLIKFMIKMGHAWLLLCGLLCWVLGAGQRMKKEEGTDGLTKAHSAF